MTGGRSRVPPLVALLVGCLFVVTACGDGRVADERPAEPAPAEAPTETAPAEAPADSVLVTFTVEEAPIAVKRPLYHESAPLRTALEWLVRGPTAQEQAAGIGSWFSEETSSVLQSVEVDAEGHATIDFQDLRPLIPNASTSAGSRILINELNGTVFQFSEVRSIEYRMDGSCALFWEWLQSDCHIETRPE